MHVFAEMLSGRHASVHSEVENQNQTRFFYHVKIDAILRWISEKQLSSPAWGLAWELYQSVFFFLLNVNSAVRMEGLSNYEFR